LFQPEDGINLVKSGADARIISMQGRFVLKFGKALISVQADSEKLLKPLSHYLRDHLVDSGSVEAEIDLYLKKILSPIPTHARLALRYYAIKVFYLAGTIYFTDFQSYLTLEPGGKKVTGYISPETLEGNEIHFFTDTFFTLVLLEMLRHQGVFSLHSAGLISPEQKAYLFPASGGEGKSTLAIYLIREGYQFISDDIIFLTRDSGKVRVLGFKKLSHISDEAMGQFPELSALKNAPSLDGKGKKIVDLDRVYPGQRAEQITGEYVIIFPKKISNGASRLQPVTQVEGFNLLLSQTPLAFIDPALAQGHFNIIRDLIHSSQLWILESGKDWMDHPAILKDLLAQAGRGRAKG